MEFGREPTGFPVCPARGFTVGCGKVEEALKRVYGTAANPAPPVVVDLEAKRVGEGARPT